MLRVILGAFRSGKSCQELGEALVDTHQKVLARRGVHIRLTPGQSMTETTSLLAHHIQFFMPHFGLDRAEPIPSPLVSSLPAQRTSRTSREPILGVPVGLMSGPWVTVRSWARYEKSGQVHPPTAQHAIREGISCSGRNIAAGTPRGSPPKSFSFKIIGVASFDRSSVRGRAAFFGVQLVCDGLKRRCSPSCS